VGEIAERAWVFALTGWRRRLTPIKFTGRARGPGEWNRGEKLSENRTPQEQRK
jgi:hypothetical protein